MFIDIGIRLIDEDGKIELYEKHFYGRLNYESKKIENIEKPEKSLHYFLYDYFSSYNHRMRDYLMIHDFGHSYKNKRKKKLEPTGFPESDLQFTIQLGNHELVSGTIPIKHFPAYSDQKKQISTGKSDTVSPIVLTQAQTLKIGHYLIHEAVKKYEKSLFLLGDTDWIS